MAKGTELIKAGDYGLVALDENSEVAEILQEALAGEQVGIGDLERVKWPAGGATKFERTVLGNTEYVDAIEGVIVYQRMSRSYWSDPEPKEGTQPDCTSPDAKWGYGNPGDELRSQTPPKGCEVCPNAQWGSARGPGDVEKRGQACKLMRDFFVLTPGATFPTIVSIPPGSLGSAKSYVVELASFGIRYYNVVSKLTLKKATNKGGQPFAQAELAMVGKLDDASVAGVASYRERMVPSLQSTRVVDTPPSSEDGEAQAA